jgi:outer membrane protein OmpA-like peptidoglycan-associated protein
LDLYKISFLGDSAWSDAVNLGTEFNTIGDERSPFIDEMGDLYFSSDGHPGLGGLDVFLVKGFQLNNPVFLENLNSPINSNRDDFFFSKSNDNYAFLSSDREGGKGSDDVYRVKYAMEEVFNLKGEVLDKQDGKPIKNSVVTAINHRTGVNTRFVTGDDGQFEFFLPTLNSYKLAASATDYLSNTIDNVLTGSPNERLQGEKYVQLSLEKMELKKTYKIENIFYDFDKWDIREDAKPYLMKLAYLLLENPTMKIELHSHTDSRGINEYNQKLSDKRAQAAVEYIVSLGISPSRITSKGFGESRLINHCKDGIDCSEDEHQENRRTEFIILDF